MNKLDAVVDILLIAGVAIVGLVFSYAPTAYATAAFITSLGQ